MVNILLDIDGVINVGRTYNQNTDIREQFGWNYAIIPKTTLSFLFELNNNPNIKITWCSTWLEESNLINRYLGIKDFNYIQLQMAEFSYWKWPSIKHYIDTKKLKNVIIIDDELSLSELRGTSILGIKTKYEEGIDIEEVRSIIKKIE